jgi:hypothetical protein
MSSCDLHSWGQGKLVASENRRTYVLADRRSYYAVFNETRETTPIAGQQMVATRRTEL